MRHGQGYSRFEHRAFGVATELTVFVPLEDPVKIRRLRLSNVSDRPRRLTATLFAEWVLGTVRERAAAQIAAGSADLVVEALRAVVDAGVEYLALRPVFEFVEQEELHEQLQRLAEEVAPQL